MIQFPEKYRIQIGEMATMTGQPEGAFYIPSQKDLAQGTKKQWLLVIASSSLGWEHVSVSLKDRCPTWEEMCYIKNLFWEKEDTVVQYHPAESDYVNLHPYCLHLWSPTMQALPIPPSILVGPKRS